MKLAEKLAEASAHSPSIGRRVLAKVIPVFVFTLVFPALLFILPKGYLDRWLQLPTILNPFIKVVVGGCLITLGIIFTFWSIKAQREIGKGTPMPLMATQKLVIQKPYLYCRNPLFFGVVNLFFGISILFDSISSLIMVLIFSLTILLYTRFIEEKELEKRFGAEYLTYKNRTSFFIPIPPTFRRKK